MLTNQQKALIHVAKQRVGMTDPEYRAMLSGFGVESCTQLRQGQFDSVMKQFAMLGFNNVRGTRNRGRMPLPQRANAPTGEPVSSRDKLRGKIKAVLQDMHLTDSYADAMANTMFQVDAWLWLDADQLHKLVAALTYHQLRHPERRQG